MSLLIDSHILIWLLYEPEHLNAAAKRSLVEANRVYISPASLWELTLKHMRGKLKYTPQQLTAGVEALYLSELAIRPEHIRTLPLITLPHSDPFDAMLIAQSQAENIVLLTADRLLLQSEYHTIAAS